jgi:hypothetical protein
MPDDPTTHGPALKNTGESANSSVPSAKDQPVSVVIVEPYRTDASGRESLIADTRYQVTTVKDVREMFLLRDKESIELALLSVLLGDFPLVAAARAVRRQWPRARILVLGQAAPVLEDYLYDEAISHTCEQQVLFDTLERLTHYPWTEEPIGRPFVVPAADYDHIPVRQGHPASTASACSIDAPKIQQR